MGKLEKICLPLLGFAAGNAFQLKKQSDKKEKSFNQGALIFELGFHIFDKWMMLKHQGKTLQKYFDDNQIKTVAIYGLGALGSRLYEDLQQLDVTVSYIIDRNAGSISGIEVPVKTLEDDLEAVDAVIITPVQYYYEIEAQVLDKMDTDVVSIEDIVDYCV